MKALTDRLITTRPKFGSRGSLFGGLAAITVAVLVGTVAVVQSFAANEQLYLAPANGSVEVGSTVAVQIRVNTGTESTNAVQANLTYDPAKLEYVNVDAAGTAFSLAANSQTAAGSIQLARATGGGEAAATGDNLFATVNFKALAGTGTASVSIAAGSHVVNATDASELLVNSAGSTFTLTSPAGPTPTPSPTPTPTPAPTATPTPAPTPTPTPGPTASPVPTATPAPTPAPTATPVPANGTLFINPAAPSVTSGQNVTIDIRENSGAVQVNAVQANLSYDPTKLQYVGVDGTGADFTLNAITDAGNGSLNLTRSVSGGEAPLTGDKLIAHVTFKAIAGSGVASISFATGSAIADTNGEDALKQSTGSNVTINAVPPVGPVATPAPTPTPVPVTPVVGTTKPVPVKGTTKLTTPAVSKNATVSYAVDSTPVANDIVDTTTLDNGTHTVTATTTDNNGAKEEVKQQIDVKNTQPLWKSLVAGATSNLPIAGLALAALLILGGGWFLLHKMLSGQKLATPEGVHSNLDSYNNDK
jgi:hypothetical protein